MDFFRRHRNLLVLALVLFVQVLGLAVQVRRSTEGGPVRLVHLWGISLITPGESLLAHSGEWVKRSWRNYFYLRDVRRESEDLRRENLRLRLEQVRLTQDASQAQRLQALLQFKEQFISETVAAQVIGSSGGEQSRVVYIDKGAKDGLKPDMAVITPAGIVGKVVRVLSGTSQVLEINDSSSGVGAILERSRLQGVLKGNLTGETTLHFVMSDERVEPGEMALTSGGDRIFPKGLPIGQVTSVSPGSDTFLRIRIRPSARLDRLEEVLVITRVVEKDRPTLPEAPMRAAEILAQRLPTVQPKPPDKTDQAAASKPNPTPGAAAAKPASGAGAPSATNPATKPTNGTKPATAGSGGTPASTTRPATTANSGNAGAAAKPATPNPNPKPVAANKLDASGAAAGQAPKAADGKPKNAGQGQPKPPVPGNNSSGVAPGAAVAKP